MTMSGEDQAPAVFRAVIVPHRSLSKRGLGILLLCLCALSGVTTALFWRLAAWPVAGFTGLELALAATLLKLNSRGARASETLTLTETGMRVSRTDAGGRESEIVLPAAWLGVRLVEAPAKVTRLLLVARGRSEEIGRALGEEEKRDLARALREALHRCRYPRFDNKQLAE
jgi:uncharacterized membrane protein